MCRCIKLDSIKLLILKFVFLINLGGSNNTEWNKISNSISCFPYKVTVFGEKNYCKKWVPEAQLGECGNARRNSRVISARLEKKMPPICRTYRTVAPSLLTRFSCVFSMQLQSFRNKSHACEVKESKIISLLKSHVNLSSQILTLSQWMITWHEDQTTWGYCNIYVLKTELQCVFHQFSKYTMNILWK
jgi:hypothetical protein